MEIKIQEDGEITVLKIKGNIVGTSGKHKIRLMAYNSDIAKEQSRHKQK